MLKQKTLKVILISWQSQTAIEVAKSIAAHFSEQIL